MSVMRNILAVGILMLCGVTAHAGVIKFSGNVTGFEYLAGTPSATPVSSFFEGQTVTGAFTLDDAVLRAGRLFGNADISSASFMVGDTSIVNAQTSIGGTIADDGQGLSALTAFTGISDFGPDCTVCQSDIGTDMFTIQSFAPGLGQIIGRFDTTIARDSTAMPVPAPGGLLGFFGFSMVGLLYWFRRARSNDRIVEPLSA